MVNLSKIVVLVMLDHCLGYVKCVVGGRAKMAMEATCVAAKRGDIRSIILGGKYVPFIIAETQVEKPAIESLPC